MACLNIHLAIAKKYLESHPDFDIKDFIEGTLYPDADPDNDKTHYTDLNRGSDLLSHLKGKVNLYAFLSEHEVISSFEFAWFLHLVTDYLFFLECFKNEYLENISYEEFCKDLYFAYYCVNGYIEENYNVSKSDYESCPNEYYPSIPYQDCILPRDLIDNFINRVSSIEIDEYIKKIKKYQCNIVP